MKNVLLLILFFGASFSLNAQVTLSDTRVATSCCEEGRGCTGSAYCSACKNCTGCKHCAKNGGSCGVCSRVRSTPSRSTTVTRKSTASKFSIGQQAIVNSPVLNLREKPSASSKILEKLKEDQQVEVLEVLESWLRVKVLSNETTGYVHKNFLK
ncbi:SH3 domain-containing protein [Leeuwenhoekiella polynyae]|uniref:SH3 domain-containing protein n=1 Tax=Leeuwenhoekiella polynyae TaxID=1550906 RepID=A0A4Q0P309_9FLAO|nr:SH3 domain-containing protein [Leeuwenhoekiella polynyae]RXG20356.1 SH3 domain-containing protein [Leeuwenhoekiella polynyae]